MSSAGYQNSGVILYVLKSRRFILVTAIVFAIIFAGCYFSSGFVSGNKKWECGTVADLQIDNDTTKRYKDGKALFQQCASCHILFKDFTGPDLIGFTKRGPWNNKKKILDYLNDPSKFYKENKTKYVIDLYNSTPVAHQAFLCKEKEIDDLVYYVEAEEKYKQAKNQQSLHLLHFHQSFIKTILRKQLIMRPPFNDLSFL